MLETYVGHFAILALSGPDVARATEEIARAGGLVVPGSRDPLLALFRGEAPDQAIRCRETLGASGLQLRAAIATGELEVTADSPDTPPVIVGDAMDRALALLSIARPGQLLVDEETRARIVEYVAEPMPGAPVKGAREPLRVYEVRRPPAVLNKVYGSMLDAMGGGTSAMGPTNPYPEKSPLETKWERSVEEGRWSGQAKSDAGPTEAGATADPVDCTVFAPPEVAAGQSFLVQVFAHLWESAEEAAELALEMDADARRRAFRSLEVPVPRGERLHFELSMPGLEIDDPVQSLVWTGRPQSAQFGVSVPPDRAQGTVIGTVTVSRRTVPIGHLKFKLAVTADARVGAAGETGTAAPDPEPRGDAAQRYARAFVSYASSDRRKVLERVQMLGALGIHYFQDVLDLEPGERWERKLYERIDDCDLFLLFWSSAAKESEWVRKEIDCALARKGGDELAPPEIRPVILEGPPIVPPPPELSHLHFSDRLIYFMVE